MLTIRKVTASDKDALLKVEVKSTPNLQYLPEVFEMFLNDARGEFMLAELDGEIVACAKFTVLANGTAWVETLRVIPEVQRQGLGKKLYRRFDEVAAEENISTMRMYTGLKNAVSRGLAEYSGFELEETFLEFTKDVEMSKVYSHHDFEVVTGIITNRSPNLSQWNYFIVMNRTFYKIVPEQFVYFRDQGQIYEDSTSNSVIVCGARFMHEQALHIGLFAGDSTICLDFANEKAKQLKAKQLSCFIPIDAESIRETLQNYGFKESSSPFVVMKKSKLLYG